LDELGHLVVRGQTASVYLVELATDYRLDCLRQIDISTPNHRKLPHTEIRVFPYTDSGDLMVQHLVDTGGIL
jgi:hypothetical protein